MHNKWAFQKIILDLLHFQNMQIKKSRNIAYSSLFGNLLAKKAKVVASFRGLNDSI